LLFFSSGSKWRGKQIALLPTGCGQGEQDGESFRLMTPADTAAAAAPAVRCGLRILELFLPTVSMGHVKKLRVLKYDQVVVSMEQNHQKNMDVVASFCFIGCNYEVNMSIIYL